MAGNSEMIKEFLVESFEGVQLCSDGLTRLERHPADKDLIHGIYRALHTIKGSACFLHFGVLQEVAHVSESLLDMIREDKIEVSSELIDALLSGVDAINQILKTVEQTEHEGENKYQETIDRISRFLIEAENESENKGPITEKSCASPQGMDQENEDTISEAQSADFGSSDHRNANEMQLEGNLTETSQAKEPIAIQQESSESSGQEEVYAAAEAVTKPQLSDAVVRVNVNLLDKIMNMVGELVLSRNQILQFSSRIDNPDLQRLSSQLDIITSDLQNDVMKTRMQPIGNVLNKFERVVRDLARETGKKINVVVEGKETELDKTLLEAIKDPLTHLVRNAVDHGLEGPEERLGSGKSEEGKLLIRAYHEGGQVTVEISDDGRGLARDKIVNKAINKGLISSAEAENLSDKAASNLIFMPGFSTAEQVTSISGRGVGMDVVKTNVEKIGGLVDVETIPGKGTKFKLKIPLTLAIIPALIVRNGKESFAIPQMNLVELVRLEGDRVNEIEKVAGSEFFRLRGDLISILRLSDLLGEESLSTESQGEQDFEELSLQQQDGFLTNSGDTINIVILNADGRIYGLIVDTVLDTQEIVVKPLSKQLKDINIFAGATIMGNGRVALIFDVMGAAQTKQLELDKEKKDIKSQPVVDVTNHGERQDILQFALRSPGSYGVPLSLINRLEELERSRIEYIGKRPIVKYRNQVMPLIPVNSYLGFDAASDFSDIDGEILSVIVLHQAGRYIGLVVDEILDVNMTEEAINTMVRNHPGILGTVFINDATVTLLDVYKVVEDSLNENRSVVSELQRKHAKILVVDDSPFFRKMGFQALSEQGYDVAMASDGEQALKILGQSTFDLVVSDIEMPVMNGFQLATAIRANDKLSKIPLIAMTTKFDDKHIKQGQEVGFNFYLEKFRKDELVNTVDKVVSKVG